MSGKKRIHSLNLFDEQWDWLVETGRANEVSASDVLRECIELVKNDPRLVKRLFRQPEVRMRRHTSDEETAK